MKNSKYSILKLVVISSLLLSLSVKADFLVGSLNTDEVFKYADDGTFLGKLVTAGSGGLDGPTGLEISADQSLLYVSSFFNDRILQFDFTTGAYISTLVPSITEPVGLGLHPNTGSLLAARRGINNRRVDEYNASTGAFIGPFTGANNNLRPRDFIFHSNGNFYLTESGQDFIYIYDSSGSYISNHIISTSTVGGIEEGPNGNLFVTDRGNHRIREIAPNGSVVGDFVPSGLGGLLEPNDLFFHPTNNLLYVASLANDAIYRFNATTGAFVDTVVSSGDNGLDSPFMMLYFNPASVANPAPCFLLSIGLALMLRKRKLLQPHTTAL